MKKVYVLVPDSHFDETLDGLQEIGVLHVQHFEEPDSSFVSHILEDQNRFRKIIEVLHKVVEEREMETYDIYDLQKMEEMQTLEQIETAAENIEHLQSSLESLEEGLIELESQITALESWGNFNPKDIEELEQQGVYVQLCDVPKEVQTPEVEGVTFQKLFDESSKKYLALSQGPVELPFPTLPLPDASLKELEERKDLEESAIEKIKDQLAAHAKFVLAFERQLLHFKEDQALEEARFGSQTIENFKVIKGYCPIDRIKKIEDRAWGEGWVLHIEDLPEDEIAPTLVKRPEALGMIEPVFSMMNIIPGYHELDISFLFLFFFAIFTGMLIGDAGYGLLMLCTTIFLHYRLRRQIKDKKILYLIYTLSTSVLVWGSLSGTFFGQGWLGSETQGLTPWLRDNNNVMLVCFLLGSTHLSIAHAWRAMIKYPDRTWIGEVGLILLIWSLFFVICNLIIKMPLPPYLPFLGGAAVILILGFIKPSKNIGKMLLGGFQELVGSFIGSFGDIISYIRLFAVGLASVAVADAFNIMASDVGFSSVTTFIGASLILILGHTLNIVLCCMGVLVHGIRLNVLEFSGHLGLEWSGHPYAPYKREIEQVNKRVFYRRSVKHGK